MKYCADLHIHSYYSRATSKQLNLEHLNKWGQIKGLKVIATGDITHPRWLQEMREKLVESEQGLFKLKDEYIRQQQGDVPKSCTSDIFFILAGEVSTIYKKNSRVRKVHSVVFMPSLDAVEKFQTKLDRIGNIHSDGRPILGLDTRDLFEITLGIDACSHFIPAHIWTPWFSVFGSKSGFDSLEECFEDLTPHIFALETGLSSDPPMNWRLSMLDRYTLVSNSDAHSPAKLAREANVFDTDLNYDAMFRALKNKKTDEFWGTIEFFPEEGKYHLDGHRKCSSCTKPSETIANNGLCPVCGKPAVLGVSYRIEELADRPEGYRAPDAKQFKSLVPLAEVSGEVLGVSSTSKRANQLYFSLLNQLGSELYILMNASLGDIRSAGGDLLAEAIKRMRDGKIHTVPGYDGQYGLIRVFEEGERAKLLQQESLFPVPDPKRQTATAAAAPEIRKKFVTQTVHEKKSEYGLNDNQQRAVEHRGTPLIIQAGPGTGKTRTLTHRIASLCHTNGAKPREVLAITFTNKAAAEMRERLTRLVGAEQANEMTIQTFHAFGAEFLREREYFFGRNWDFRIISPVDESIFREQLNKMCGEKVSNSMLGRLSSLKTQGYTPDSVPREILETSPASLVSIFQNYEYLLIQQNGVDFDDLINLPVRLLRQSPELRREYVSRFPVIAVDEFQDINKSQYELFRILALAARDVCVIGDPDQAIYGFRGANAAYFKRFKEHFPSATTILLQRNYRSAQNILSASLQMLGRASVPEDQLWSNITSDVKVHIKAAATDRAEAEFVVHRIEQHVGGTTFFSLDSGRVDNHGLPQDFTFADFAVLLRSRRLAPPLFEAFTRSGLPFHTVDDSTLTSHNFVHLLAVLLQSEVPGKSDAIKSTATLYFSESDVPLFMHELQALPDKNPGTIIEWLEKFNTVADDEETRHLLKTLKILSGQFGEKKDKFLDFLMLQKHIDNFDERTDRIHLMTLHAAKGLEFPVVFIVGCEEGVLPHYAPGQKIDVDEERRLLYVGMTRAQDHLYLTHSKQRVLYGRKQIQEPSRFLDSISQSLLTQEQQKYKAKKKDNQLSLF
ncbi:UvrD-helicase domain-containing protein [candidate division KSB1 bacterium]|nr:UvrD-helicase domain-containing protein [candidate division KSB1 bacterium]